jgi:hypothetical protein
MKVAALITGGLIVLALLYLAAVKILREITK